MKTGQVHGKSHGNRVMKFYKIIIVAKFRYASNLNFHVPRVRSNCGKHSFKFAITITITLGYYQFKKQCKRILLTLKGNKVKSLFLITVHSYSGTERTYV